MSFVPYLLMSAAGKVAQAARCGSNLHLAGSRPNIEDETETAQGPYIGAGA